MESVAKGGRRSVVVILDASRDESLKAIERVWKEFSLESGDDLIILAVLHQVNSPMGYKVTVDYNSMFGTNERVVEDALAVKEKELMVKKEIISISNACQTDKVRKFLPPKPYLRESDTICNIKLSPANSDSSPGNGRDSPGTNVDDDDNDHAKYDLKTPTMYSTRYYDHNTSGTGSQSYSTRSTSSSESSSMFTPSVVSSLDNRDYLYYHVKNA